MTIEEQAAQLTGIFSVNEDHGKKLSTDMVSALASYEDFRQKVKTVVETNYPDKSKDFVKFSSAVDKAIADLSKFIGKL